MLDHERRRFPRILLNGRCWCEAKDVSVFAQMGNVSEDGLFVRTKIPLAIGTKATVRFKLGEEGPEHEVEAVVVWGTGARAPGPAGMGLRFTKPQAEMVETIRKLVQVVAGQGT